jgi:hypothetical protein
MLKRFFEGQIKRIEFKGMDSWHFILHQRYVRPQKSGWLSGQDNKLSIEGARAKDNKSDLLSSSQADHPAIVLSNRHGSADRSTFLGITGDGRIKRNNIVTGKNFLIN